MARPLPDPDPQPIISAPLLLNFLYEEMRVLFYDKQPLAYICGSDRFVAGSVDSGATLLSISKNGGGTKLYSDEPESAYSLNKVIAETSGRRLAFVEG